MCSIRRCVRRDAEAPEQAQSKLNEGLVLSVGPGRRDKDGALLPMGVKIDDKVLLPQYGGSEITIDDEDLVLKMSVTAITASVILAIIGGCVCVRGIVVC